MSELFRDPRYVIPLIMLMFVIVVSAATGAGPGAVDSAVPSLPYVPREEGVPAPDLARDYARGVDLGKLREAAIGYFRETGSFPDTENQAVAICKEGANRACALRLVQEDLPLDDGDHPYYYASDGATYALFIAKAEVKGDMSQCPDLVPVELASSPLMCTRLEAPQ